MNTLTPDSGSGDAAARAPKFPAVFAIHTVSGMTYACMDHARALISLMGFMGASSLPQVLDEEDPHECANCVNEARRHA
jgi:hypothetical protein